MARIITVANQKGGVGKTTTSHALATGLKTKGYDVLVVDVDPQANITYAMGASEEYEGVYELMRVVAKDGVPHTLEYIQNTPQGDVIASSLDLSGADLEFNIQGREYLLKEILAPVGASYNYVVIDTPPTLGILTINALTASNDVIVPMGAEILSLKGLAQLYKTIQRTRKHSNPDLEIAGLLLTKYNSRTVLGKSLKEDIQNRAKDIGTVLFDTTVREGVVVREAQTHRLSVFDYAPTSNPAIDYMKFIDEYLERGK